MCVCGIHQFVADDEKPMEGAGQTGGHDIDFLLGGALTLGGQLCPHIWLHLRVPAFLCTATVRVVWSIRQAKEGVAHLGVSGGRGGDAHSAYNTLLCHAHIRVQDLRIP